MSNKVTNQFEIWEVDLKSSKGAETKGIRPCLVLQTNAVSDIGKTTLIAPITSKKTEKIYPFQVKLAPSKHNGLRKPSKIKFDQIRVIDKQRLIKKRGEVEEKYVEKILDSMDIIFDVSGNFRG